MHVLSQRAYAYLHVLDPTPSSQDEKKREQR